MQLPVIALCAIPSMVKIPSPDVTKKTSCIVYVTDIQFGTTINNETSNDHILDDDAVEPSAEVEFVLRKTLFTCTSWG